MLNTKRRSLLRYMIANGMAGALISAGLITPRQLLAAWPEMAFSADDLDSVLRALYSSENLEESDLIDLKIPAIAENGAIVPIRVETDLEKVKTISIIVVENPTPLAAMFELTPLSIPNVSIRIKMAKTSDVLVVIDAGNKTYVTRQNVKVTIGGCG